MPTFVPRRIGVVGLGLMGGSFAKAYSAAGWEIFAWNRTRSTTELAMIEVLTGELTDEVLPTCELIVLAGYPQFSVDWLTEKSALVSPGAIVIDAVGVKREVCEACEKIARSWDATRWREPNSRAMRIPGPRCSKARRWWSSLPPRSKAWSALSFSRASRSCLALASSAASPMPRPKTTTA